MRRADTPTGAELDIEVHPFIVKKDFTMNMQTTTAIQSIPLNQLRRSKNSNARKTGTSINELADSIARIGLLQNLNVTAGADGAYGVIAGGRRLAALQRLAKQKRIPNDYPVPCRVIDESAALTASLTENVHREAMSPADEFEAFALLVAQGQSVEDVAANFGVTPLVVRRRLKLANVSPRLIADYRANEVTLEQLMALAVVDDHAAQEAAFFDAPQWQRSPENLRDHLTRDEVDASTDRVARFVGLAAYEEAGGAVRRDLFAEDEQDGFIVDVALLDQLARDRLAPLRAEAEAAGWVWVNVAPRSTSSELAGFQRARRVRGSPTAKQQRRLDALAAECAPIEARIEELENGDADVMEATQAEYQELQAKRDALDAQREAIEDQLLQYEPAVKALAGAVVTLDHAGKPIVQEGLLRPEDAKIMKRQEQTATQEPANGDAVERPAKQGISEALARKLSSHRTAALQIELARQPAIALAALVHPLALRLLFDEYAGDCPVKISGTRQTKLATFADDLDGAPAALAFAECLQAWQSRLPDSPEQLFARLLELPQCELLELLAVCVASTIDVVTSDEASTSGSDLARVLNLDMRQWWAATATSYFGQVSKSKIVEAVQTFAPNHAARAGTLKKSDMTSEAERLAAGSGWLPEILRTAR
jgi:ParB family transcriptional regulator, chromosome partitioning protein